VVYVCTYQIEKLPYLSNSSTDCHEIWRDDATQHRTVLIIFSLILQTTTTAQTTSTGVERDFWQSADTWWWTDPS